MPSLTENDSNRRLDSWKEIALYLGRDVRTARRWERDKSLPVHRVAGGKGHSVFAYTEELDAWLSGSTAREPEIRARRPKAWAGAAVVALVLAVTLGGWWMWSRKTHPERAALDFQESDWILICRFDNRTGETVLDGTIEYALEQELGRSRFVRVVAPERVRDALELMKKPSDTVVDRNVGREVCVRDGGIRALLTGRVEKLGATYRLSVQLLEPPTGRTVGGITEEAAGQEAVFPALRRLSNWARQSLGEQIDDIRQSNLSLEKVTTPSLPALQLYTQADAFMRGAGKSRQKAAEELLRRCIILDPRFASAHMHLAWTIRNQGRPAVEFLPHARVAVALSAEVSPQERYFILGSEAHLRGDYQASIPFWEALTQVSPSHYWAHGNLVAAIRASGDEREALPYVVNMADSRPNSALLAWFAADLLVGVSDDVDSARPYVERAKKLISGEGRQPLRPYPSAWLRLFEARAAWVRGDAREAARLSQSIAHSLPSQPDERTNVVDGLVDLHGMLGMRVAETEYWRRFRVTSRRALLEPTFREPAKLTELIRAGRAAEARRLLAEWEKTSYGSGEGRTFQNAIRGELASANGDLEAAVPLLEEAARTALRGWPTTLHAFESLASIWQRKGDLPRAIRVLEEASQQKTAAGFRYSSALWINIRFKLMQLYRKVGRVEDADAIAAELRKLLSCADPDHPIVRALTDSDANSSKSR